MKNSRFLKIFTICVMVILLSLTAFLVNAYNDLAILFVYLVLLLSVIVCKFLEKRVFPKKQISDNWKALIAFLIIAIPAGIVGYVIEHWDIVIPFR